MSQNWYHSQSWYAPLVSEETEMTTDAAPAVNQTAEKRRRRTEKKGLTPGRIAGLVIILLLVIVGTSLACWHVGGEQTETLPILPEERSEMPDNPADFFEQFYEEVESSSVEVNVPILEERPTMTIALQETPEEELSLQELYEKCAPAIVSISAYEGESVGYNWGSGVVIREDGVVLTNTHVLEDSDRAIVTFDDGSEYEAKLIGADGISDIALLKSKRQGSRRWSSERVPRSVSGTGLRQSEIRSERNSAIR